LRSELSIDDLGNIKVKNKVNPEALEYYLKGERFFESYIYSQSENKFKKSESMFVRAISVDSAYMEPYAGLADLYWQKANYSGDKIYEWKSDSISNIAYQLNPNNAYVVMSRGLRYLFDISENNNIDSAFHYYSMAYEINPNHLYVLQNLVTFYRTIGLYDVAIAIDRSILQNDPLNSYSRGTLAGSLLMTGNYKEARVNYNKVLELDPNNLAANQTLLFIAVFYDKDMVEAKRISSKLKDTYPARDYSYYESWLLALEGKKEEALSLSKGMTTYSLLDMKGEGINLVDSINTIYDYTGFYTYIILKNHILTEFIRDEPRFKEILAEAKKVHEERVRKYGHLFDEE
jgi:tetratricopeptide (TPR) repeat protein